MSGKLHHMRLSGKKRGPFLRLPIQKKHRRPRESRIAHGRRPSRKASGQKPDPLRVSHVQIGAKAPGDEQRQFRLRAKPRLVKQGKKPRRDGELLSA